MSKLLVVLVISLVVCAQPTITPSSVSVPLGQIVHLKTPGAIVPFYILSGAGEISAREGYYTAPSTMPDNPVVIVRVVDFGNAAVRSDATITIVKDTQAPMVGGTIILYANGPIQGGFNSCTDIIPFLSQWFVLK